MKTKILILISLNVFLMANSQTITVPISTYGTLAPVTVSYSGASGVAGSWIGLYRAEGGDGDYLTYQYINESQSGSLDFAGREETGLFNFRLFRGGGYDKIGTSATFMIRQGMIPDLAFQDNGVFHRDFLGNSLNDWAVAVRVTSDDKIVVAGTAKTGLSSPSGHEQNEFVAVRFLANGQLDPDFGIGGMARAAFPGMYYSALYINAFEARALAVQDDGKVIVGGIALVTGAEFGVKAVVLVRFDDNGNIDNTFGDKGVMVDNFKWPSESATFAWDDLRCIELDSQGRILVGGGSLLDRPYSPGRPFVGRYTRDGAPDDTFGTLGMITPSDSIAFRGYVESIVPSGAGGDGSIFAGITQVSQFGMNYSVILKVDDQGKLVTDFGHQGVLVEHRPRLHNDQNLKSMGYSADGKLVLMGGSASWAVWIIARNPVDGSSINAFGKEGLTFFDPTYSVDVPAGMVLTPDNQIVVGTTTMSYRWSVARFESNGSLRSDFGVPFYQLMENGSMVESFITGIGMQDDGKYVLVGGSRFPGANHWDLMVLRFVDNPETLAGIEENQAVTSQLLQNFPNPFSRSTMISWDQPLDSHVKLTVFDILGNRIAEPVNEVRPAGRQLVLFEPGADGSMPLPTGTYFYQITIQPVGSHKKAYAATRKMTVLPGIR